eukprot:TRINITY_DN34758_c0_g1_i1.p1 TRINITY_DN34758_c0_g1~~TRINITY_DN34758_c0_g1_i1.p1  ORF type:complete len:277 (+),score=82.29 TRINITY_DN34758_c0_g1_i1:71-832(+)
MPDAGAAPLQGAADGAAALLIYCARDMREHRRRFGEFLRRCSDGLRRVQHCEISAALLPLRPHGWDDDLTQALVPELLSAWYCRQGRSGLEEACEAALDSQGDLRVFVERCSAQLRALGTLPPAEPWALAGAGEQHAGGGAPPDPGVAVGGSCALELQREGHRLGLERALGLCPLVYACIRAFREQVLGRRANTTRVFGSLTGCAAVLQRPLYCLKCCTPWCSRQCLREEWPPLRALQQLLALAAPPTRAGAP